MRQFNMTAVAALTCGSVLLGGCSFYGKVKDIAYDKAASIGNSYCETQDPSMAADLKGRVNNGLRDAGAEFEFDGIACDP